MIKSIPEGINLRVLISLDVKLKDNKTFKQIKNIQANLGLKVKSQIPTKTKIPLATPITSEILLPFLNPIKPPRIRSKAYAIKTMSMIINGGSLDKNQNQWCFLILKSFH